MYTESLMPLHVDALLRNPRTLLVFWQVMRLELGSLGV